MRDWTLWLDGSYSLKRWRRVGDVDAVDYGNDMLLDVALVLGLRLGENLHESLCGRCLIDTFPDENRDAPVRGRLEACVFTCDSNRLSIARWPSARLPFEDALRMRATRPAARRAEH